MRNGRVSISYLYLVVLNALVNSEVMIEQLEIVGDFRFSAY